MYDLIHTEVAPILFNKIMAHSNNSDQGVHSPTIRGDNQTRLMRQLLDKLDSLQNSLHINDPQSQAKAEVIARDIEKLDELCFKIFSSNTEQMNDLIFNENNSFEQLKRRLGDTCSTMGSMNDTLLRNGIRLNPSILKSDQLKELDCPQAA